MIVFLSLGSNLGDRLSNLEEAISLISKTKNIDMLVKSKIYETSPMENLDQDNFLNQVIQVNAAIKPLKLLKILILILILKKKIINLIILVLTIIKLNFYLTQYF